MEIFFDFIKSHSLSSVEAGKRCANTVLVELEGFIGVETALPVMVEVTAAAVRSRLATNLAS